MPLLRLQTSIPVENEKRTALLEEATRIVSTVTGKPQTYMMALFCEGTGIMAGTADPTAFV